MRASRGVVDRNRWLRHKARLLKVRQCVKDGMSEQVAWARVNELMGWEGGRRCWP